MGRLRLSLGQQLACALERRRDRLSRGARACGPCTCYPSAPLRGRARLLSDTHACMRAPCTRMRGRSWRSWLCVGGGDRGYLGCEWGLSRGLADGVLLALELVRGELLSLLRLQLGRHRLGRRLLRRARRGGRLGGGGARLVD